MKKIDKYSRICLRPKYTFVFEIQVYVIIPQSRKIIVEVPRPKDCNSFDDRG